MHLKQQLQNVILLYPCLFLLILSLNSLSLNNNKATGQDSSSPSISFCVACAIPACTSGQILSMPQDSCAECPTCIDTSNSSSSSGRCSTDSDCPPGICPNGQTYQAYTCQAELGNCFQLQFFADPCQFLISSSSGSVTSDCKCPDGLTFLNNECAVSDFIACTADYSPVCGCDGNTYSNGCNASTNGIKKFTEGECTSNLNNAFTGIWRGKLPKCKTLLSIKPSGVGEAVNCVVCPLVQILCAPGFIGVPDTCEKCAYCARCNPRSGHLFIRLCIKDGKVEGTINAPGSIVNGKIISYEVISPVQVIVTVLDKKEHTETLTLELLPTDKILKVTFENGESFETKKIGKYKCNSQNSPDCLRPCGLKCCKSYEKCEIAITNSIPPATLYTCIECPISACAVAPPGCTYVDNSLPTECPTCGELVCSSSGGFSECASRGSCRGKNGEELPCPKNTECSGLPAYGCYPPGCPVPICCSPDTRIRTTGVQKRIADVKKDDLVLSDGEKPFRVIKISKIEVKDHKILKVRLNDGTLLEISPRHPTSDGRLFKDLKVGDRLDGRLVVEIKSILYKFKYTYDILPDSKTGNYYANGVLIGSTLKRY